MTPDPLAWGTTVTILLTDGNRVTGRVVYRRDDAIMLASDGGQFTIWRRAIVGVDPM